MPRLSDRPHSPSEIQRRLETISGVATEIHEGLGGKPFQWNGAEGEWKVLWAEDLGITLLTKTALEKRGYRLKRGAKPIGRRYFGAPIQKYAELYVLECQCVRE